MHTIKITPNLLFEYQCTSGKFIRLPNRIEWKLFCPNWNALTVTTVPDNSGCGTDRVVQFCVILSTVSLFIHALIA